MFYRLKAINISAMARKVGEIAKYINLIISALSDGKYLVMAVFIPVAWSSRDVC